MKKLMFFAVMMVMLLSANAMSYKKTKSETLFLTDKMAHELSLTDEQYEAVYEINLDYLLCLGSPEDLFGTCWERRNADLRLVLSSWQYDTYQTLEYFYRPVKWEADAWVFDIYTQYAKDIFFFAPPKAYRIYKGGNSHLDKHFYADRVANKPASAKHQQAPAFHHTNPIPQNNIAPNNNNRPATPNNANKPTNPNNNKSATPNNNKPATPNNVNKPATPNNDNRPATPNNVNRPSGGPGPGAGGAGGGRPAGGPGGGGPGGHR
jgi:hypothetical protein